MVDTCSVDVITCSRYISAITVSKVPRKSHKNKEKGNFNYSQERLRTIQRQLECISRKEWVDDFAKNPQVEKGVYSDTLELCTELKWEVAKLEVAWIYACYCSNVQLMSGEWKNTLHSIFVKSICGGMSESKLHLFCRGWDCHLVRRCLQN